MVAVIIPAFNEEDRLGCVLWAVMQAELPDEIIVVSDGSTDSTVAIARSMEGVKVIDLPFNRGKGGAMAAGVAATKADIVAFVDGDLKGLKPAHVDNIIRPIVEHKADMCIGVFRGGEYWSDASQRFFPYISGQRAMRRKLFDDIPFISEIRMGVEVTLNTYAKRRKARILRVVLPGVSNTYKENKMGLVKGATARAKMYTEIGRAMMRMHRKKGKKSSERRPWL
jgi:polyisoprenyl-phosphate glycosyltransferase